MNVNKMTQKTLEALQSAQSLCTAYQNNAIEPIHLFAALMQQTDGLIPQLMQRIGISAESAAKTAEQAVAALPHVTGSGRPGGSFYVSRETDQIMTDAEETAKQMQDEYVSAEHILLSMLRGKNSTLQKIFAQYQITEPKVLAALKEIRGNTRITNETPEAT